MATFQKRVGKNGTISWQAKVRRRGLPVQTETFARKIDAEKWAFSIEGDMARGRFVDMKAAERLTLTLALDRYEVEVSASKKGHKQEKSRIALWKSCAFANKGLAFIHNDDIASWRDERIAAKVAPNTIKNDLILLSHLFSVASKDFPQHQGCFQIWCNNQIFWLKGSQMNVIAVALA